MSNTLYRICKDYKEEMNEEEDKRLVLLTKKNVEELRKIYIRGDLMEYKKFITNIGNYYYERMLYFSEEYEEMKDIYWREYREMGEKEREFEKEEKDKEDIIDEEEFKKIQETGEFEKIRGTKLLEYVRDVDHFINEIKKRYNKDE